MYNFGNCMGSQSTESYKPDKDFERRDPTPVPTQANIQRLGEAAAKLTWLKR